MNLLDFINKYGLRKSALKRFFCDLKSQTSFASNDSEVQFYKTKHKMIASKIQ